MDCPKGSGARSLRNRSHGNTPVRGEAGPKKRGGETAAAKQSGRMIVPKVEPVVSFSHGCLQMQKLDVGLIPYELTRGMEETRRTLARIRPGMEIGIMIGPEGGFDVEEVKEAVNAKICPITLGRRILRTETAGMAALAVLMFLLEDS